MDQTTIRQEVLNFARTIEWLGQATVRIDFNGNVIYIDPYHLNSSDQADLILITHDHQDHLSFEDIRKIADKNTHFVAASSYVKQLQQSGYKHIQSVVPGTKVTDLGLGISAVPAYNLIKTMHPRDRNYVGYLIDFDGIVLYHTGDTERIPEMQEISCVIIMLPLGQTYTMNSVEDAVGVVMDTKASIAIPIHWGLYEGTAQDEEKFRKLLETKKVTVLSGK